MLILGAHTRGTCPGTDTWRQATWNRAPLRSPRQSWASDVYLPNTSDRPLMYLLAVLRPFLDAMPALADSGY